MNTKIEQGIEIASRPPVGVAGYATAFMAGFSPDQVTQWLAAIGALVLLLVHLTNLRRAHIAKKREQLAYEREKNQ